MRLCSALLAVATIAASGWQGSLHAANSFTSGFKFLDPAIQALFVKGLEDAHIDVEVDASGTALYDQADEERASRLRFAILRETYVPAYHFKDVGLEQRFIDELKVRHIEFAIQIRDGARWITWAKVDDERVEALRRSLIAPQRN